jgi:hypothetical protein
VTKLKRKEKKELKLLRKRHQESWLREDPDVPEEERNGRP